MGFRNIAGWFFITLSIAARPPTRKAACISRMVSALSSSRPRYASDSSEAGYPICCPFFWFRFLVSFGF
jgi:hypothetical protein